MPLERVEAEGALALRKLAPRARSPLGVRSRRAGHRGAASRRATSARRRRRARVRAPRAPCGRSAARSTRSARGRSCRTGCSRRGEGDAGPRSSPRRRAPAPLRMPPTKSLRSGTWAITLLAASRSAARPSAASRPASSRPKNSTIVSMPRSRATLRDVGGGLDAERRDPPLHDVLQQVAVVARELHHETAFVKPESLHRHLDVVAGVRDPRIGVRGEIRVLAEDRVSSNELLELHEQAALADLRVQRIKRLHRRDAIRRHVALAQRRHAEIDERVLKRRAAEAARRPGRVRHQRSLDRGLGEDVSLGCLHIHPTRPGHSDFHGSRRAALNETATPRSRPTAPQTPPER